MTAQVERLVAEKNLIPLGYKKITGLSVVKTLADGAAIPASACYALLYVETQDVRWRDDGTNPTATDGVKLVKDKEFMYKGNLAAIKFLELAASAVLHVTFYMQ